MPDESNEVEALRRRTRELEQELEKRKSIDSQLDDLRAELQNIRTRIEESDRDRREAFNAIRPHLEKSAANIALQLLAGGRTTSDTAAAAPRTAATAPTREKREGGDGSGTIAVRGVPVGGGMKVTDDRGSTFYPNRGTPVLEARVSPGRHRVDVEASGFRQVEPLELEIGANEFVTVDAKLELEPQKPSP